MYRGGEMLVLHYECHKKRRLPVRLWTEIQEKYGLLSSPPPAKEMRPSAFPPLIYFWMNEEGWDGSTIHARRGGGGCCSLASALQGGGLGCSSKMQESSIEFFLCWSGPEHVPLTRVPRLPCQECFGGDEFWVPAAKINETLVTWGSQAEVPPSSPVPKMLP